MHENHKRPQIVRRGDYPRAGPVQTQRIMWFGRATMFKGLSERGLTKGEALLC